MSTSQTTTANSTAVGSIPITGGTNNQPPAPTRPTTPSASDEERELEMEMEHNRERMRALRERRKAKEEAKKRAEEEAARWAAEEEQQRQEAAARAVSARRKEEEAAEKRRRIVVAVAARSCQGPAPGEASTSRRQMEGTGKPSTEAGDPDDGDNRSDGEDDDEDDEERPPCERCRMKKIPCLQQEGKRSTLICKPCHDSKDRGIGEPNGSIAGRQSTTPRRKGKSPPPAPIAGPSELPKKRRRVVDSDKEEVEEEGDKGEEGEEEGELALKKARSEKEKDRAE
ncbi:hypothetical protein F5876DRAFT_83484 [Lentinula aff. lateritia]|uniref:Uncharacterized protein n=1 Tax=Lentinula aff. lateritia TaxID=2804960 RepID=A0ACC1THZ6_9AGAR|nr:hypothetical protein F5876DRAFT_83484 [Lentinula aff. lateritia]